MGVAVSGQPNENMRMQFDTAVHVQLELAMRHTDGAIDLPDVMQDETWTIRFDDAETPTIESIGATDDDREMRVTFGQLTLSSTAMEQDVVISEGMCMGSDDGEELSEEERDARHDLFGEMVEVMCGD